MNKIILLLTLLTLSLSVVACGDNEGEDNKNNTNNANNTDIKTPTTFVFLDAQGKDTVAYSGQTSRHVLIEDLKTYIGKMTEEIIQSRFEPTEPGSVVAELNYYFRFDGDANDDNPFTLTTTPPPLQTTYGSISTKKDLIGKLAGNDASTDHKNWNGGDFKGWKQGQPASPTALIDAWFATIEANAIALVAGTEREAYGQKLPVYVTESGQDLNQLIQKFLSVGIGFSQGVDDYADDDKPGKGILSPNTVEEGKNYTFLGHAWDEAFGYFGASRNYGTLTDDEISEGCAKDVNGDGKLDLTSELCFGASVNAAKRDKGSAAAARTDLTREAWDGFIKGRALIAAAGPELTPAQLTELKKHRDQWANAWEKTYAATCVHYINKVLKDMDNFGKPEYKFLDHAKHWSELKGFALGFQFNPRSPLSAANFVKLHDLIGDAPVLPDAGDAASSTYRSALLEARGILKDAYAFDEANVTQW